MSDLFGLDETHLALQSAARDFSRREITPLSPSSDKDNTFPPELWKKLGSAGYLGITAGTEYGGGGMGYLAHCLAMEEISRASAGIGLSYGAHSNLCVNQIQVFGTEEQREKFLPRLISGEHIGALAMSETGSGSDVMSMKTRAERIGEEYVLNGGKMWITNGPTADVLVVYAVTSPEKMPHGCTAFLIEGDFSGFSRGRKLDKLGMRGSDTCELFFDNCRVPAENVLGGENNGAKVLMRGLDYERVILSAGPLGIMSACLEVSLEYAQTRKQFGSPISEYQLIRGKLADMYTLLSASRSLTRMSAVACDEGKTTRRDSAAAILFSSENATRCALEAVQILGANGYTREYPAERLLRDAKLYEIGAGTSEIRRLLIAREIIEKSA